MRTLIAVSCFALFAVGCTSTSDTTAPVSAETPPVEQPIMPSAYGLAMDTVDQLVAAGNEQHAIDRIMQLLGNPDLSDEESANSLMRLGELRYGEGQDVIGAIEAWDELIETYPASEAASEAEALRDFARGEATSLNSMLAMGDLSPTEEFEVLFRLGQHQDAADVMFDRNLKPENTYLVDLFQVGYLCDDANLTGPSYDMVEPDGTARTVRFCEFGK